MPLFNNPARVIAEAGAYDLQASGNVLIESAANDFESTYKSLPTLEEGRIVYSEEVVPVFDAGNGVAVVELENVVKFMEYAEIEDITEAVEKIAEHYGIDMDKIGIVIESDEELDDVVDEAKCSAKKGNKKKLEEVSEASNLLKKIKDKGLKVFKKPKKKNCKPGKKC